MLKFIGCFLLSATCVSTFFLFIFLVIWTYEKITGSSADLDVVLLLVTIIITLSIIFYYAI